MRQTPHTNKTLKIVNGQNMKGMNWHRQSGFLAGQELYISVQGIETAASLRKRSLSKSPKDQHCNPNIIKSHSMSDTYNIPDGERC